MSKTVDDLVLLFDKAYCDKLDDAEGTRAGVRAVVEALRDESYACDCGDEWLTMLDEILAPREGGNGAAGVTALEAVGAGLSPASGQAPAAPAPVCEWVGDDEFWNWTCDSSDEILETEGFKFCPSCGLPIKFTEAQR